MMFLKNVSNSRVNLLFSKSPDFIKIQTAFQILFCFKFTLLFIFILRLVAFFYLFILENFMQSQNIEPHTISSIELSCPTDRSHTQDDENNNPIIISNRARQSKPRKAIPEIENEKFTNIMEFAKQVRKIKYVKQFIHNLKRTIVSSENPYQQHSFALNQMPGRLNTHNSDNQNSKFLKHLNKIYQIIKFGIFLLFFLTVSIHTAFHVEDRSIFLTLGLLCTVIEIVQIYISIRKIMGRFQQKLNHNKNWFFLYVKKTINWLLLGILTLFSIFYEHDSVTSILSLLYLVQIIQSIQQLKQVENYIISSTNLENYWNISKIILCNFFIAHCLSILLNLITHIQDNQQNWYLLKNLHEESPWHEKYIWGCYWGTTIMLTLGFGDISANNLSEAICLIFIMTFSCIILAFNIAEVSKILSKMGELQLQKNQKLKTLYNFSNSHSLSDQIHGNIKNSIQKSFELKKQFNFEQEKEFLSSLPEKLEKQVGREINNRIFGTISFFKNLTQACQLKVAECIQKFMAHPDQILLKKGDIWKMYLIKKGSLCLTYRQDRSFLNGTSIDIFSNVDQSANKLVSLGFIKKKRILGDLKSLAFSLLLTIQNEELQQILKSKDETMYQYYCVERDRDEKQETQLYLCPQCQQDRHSQIFCPKLHYCPLKDHLIAKNLRLFSYPCDSQKQPRVHMRRRIKNPIANETLKNFTFIQENVLFKIISQENQGLNFNHSKQLYDDPKLGISFQPQQYGQNYNIKLEQIQKSINKVIDCLTNTDKNLQVDQATNYKGYFPKFNPQNLYKINTIKNIKAKCGKKKFTKFGNSAYSSV